MTIYNGSDDQAIPIIRRDLSGGLNTRQYANLIGETQATVLTNVDIGVSGEASKRRGSVLIGNDVSNNDIVGLVNYIRQGYDDTLLHYEGTTIREWTGSGNWSAAIKADFTAAQTDVGFVLAKESGLTPDDIVIVQNGTDNPFRLHKDSTGAWDVQDLGTTTGASASPPKSTVMCWYGNRVWVLKNDLLYFSDAYDSDYSSAFDTSTGAFRVPVGEERKLLATRDMGIICMGEEGIWQLTPTTAGYADPTVVQPQPVLVDLGVVSKKGAVVAADDIFFFSHDGLRGLKRTQQDKVQSGESYPISHRLKTEFERISWGYIDKLAMLYWDNKVIVSVPTSETTYDTWIYHPSLNSFYIIQGWSPFCWEKARVDNQEYAYYGKDGNGTVYQAFTGYTDEGTTATNGTAITYTEEGREEDMGMPLNEKVGGELWIKALATGDYNIDVYISLDGSEYQSLGTVNLGAGSISLPQSLPFTLSNLNIVIKKFKLARYGPWTTLKIKLVHDDANGSDEITVYERSIVTFKNEYKGV